MNSAAGDAPPVASYPCPSPASGSPVTGTGLRRAQADGTIEFRNERELPTTEEPTMIRNLIHRLRAARLRRGVKLFDHPNDAWELGVEPLPAEDRAARR